MNDHIHLDTLKNFILKRYGIQSEIICQKAANQHQYCTMIVEKDSNVALVTFKSNESNFNEDTVILINNDGQQINNGRILFFAMSVNIFTNSPYRWCIEDQLIKNGKLRLLRKPATADEFQEIQKLELERYPRSTGIILNATISGADLSECMVDKIVYTDDYKFSELQRGRSSNILTEYNKCIYDSYIQGRNTILVINKTNGDGILVDSQGYDYPRYSSYIPKISHYIDYWMDNDMAYKVQQLYKLYIPVQVHFEQQGEPHKSVDELETVSPADYYVDIKIAIAKDIVLNGKRGLARDIKDQELKMKVYSLMPDIDYENNTVCGVMVARITEPLTESDISKLKEYCTEQFANEFGKHFESQAIAVNDGKIFVRFYTQDYTIKTEDEMYEARQSHDQEMQGPALSM